MAVRNDPQRREAIIEAAWACFLQHGYAKTSLEDVARRAGLSRPLIYLQFANKQELFVRTIETMMDEHFACAKAVLTLDLDRKTKLLRIIDVWLLEPLAELMAAPQGDELFEQALGITPTVQCTHHERTRELLAPVIRDPAAVDVFRLAMKGLLTDRPSIEILRARVAVLAEHFVI
jgi:TetR/AcrR family transcriptional regulator, transcriptional repressor of aconitase